METGKLIDTGKKEKASDTGPSLLCNLPLIVRTGNGRISMFAKKKK